MTRSEDIGTIFILPDKEIAIYEHVKSVEAMTQGSYGSDLFIAGRIQQLRLSFDDMSCYL